MSNRLDEMIESVSRRAFSSSSGTYNVRALELQRERKLNIINVTVLFLDDTQHSFQIEVSTAAAADRQIFVFFFLFDNCMPVLS